MGSLMLGIHRGLKVKEDAKRICKFPKHKDFPNPCKSKGVTMCKEQK